jgi:hypothetical protein
MVGNNNEGYFKAVGFVDCVDNQSNNLKLS